MRRALIVLAAVTSSVVLAACGSGPQRGQDLYVVSSSGNGNTARFAPVGAWDLSYSWDCAKAISEGIPGVQGIDAVIYNSDDQSTAFEHPEVTGKAVRGKGVLHYKRGGDYFVGLQTRCDWTIDVVVRS